MSIIRKLLKAIPLFARIKKWTDDSREYKMWIKSGNPAPPPHRVKRENLLMYARMHGLNILVETGTYYGDMIYSLRRHFSRIFSIELSGELYEKAVKRFRGIHNITLIHGDSALCLAGLIPKLDCPTLFWLDGHYSGGVTAMADRETPILEELRHISCSPIRGHVIVIDDSRCFDGSQGYPTIDELRDVIRRHWPAAKIEELFDSIVVIVNGEQKGIGDIKK